MKEFGVDISKWNGNFNFEKAISSGVKFVILRGAYHKTKDSKFESFYKSAKAKGLPIGVYQYSMAKTVAEAKAEAEFLFENCLKGKKFELPIYFDVEDRTQHALGKTKLTEIVKAWCEALEAKNYFVGVYSSASFFKSYLNDSELKSYAHWVAQWTKNCTYGNPGMWQFGGEVNYIRSNKIAGTVTDQNYMFVDYPSIIKAKGCNGFGEKDPFPDLGSTTLRIGMRGTHVKNLQTVLTALKFDCGRVDGVFGINTLTAVKSAQRAYKCSVDGLCGKNTKAALKAAW